MDYCAGILTSHQLDSFVEECIIYNGGKLFDIWCDDYYVIMNKEWYLWVLIELINERDKLYVIPLLDDLENAVHENSFENGYDMGYVNGLMTVQ